MFKFKPKPKSSRVVPATREEFENSTADDERDPNYQLDTAKKMLTDIKAELEKKEWRVISNTITTDTQSFTITFTCSNGSKTFDNIVYDSGTNYFTHDSGSIGNSIFDLKRYIDKEEPAPAPAPAPANSRIAKTRHALSKQVETKMNRRLSDSGNGSV
jgi:hypothetical protein